MSEENKNEVDSILEETEVTKVNRSSSIAKTIVFVIIIGGLGLWGGMKWNLPEDTLEKTVKIVNVTAESTTFGYLAARKAELVPNDVAEIVDNIGDALLEASSSIEQEKIKLTEVKTEVTNLVNKFIDEKFGDNTLYKTLVDILISAGFNSAETYLTEVKDTTAQDWVKIIAAMRAGILEGSAPFRVIESSKPVEEVTVDETN